jgi:hypothetical protein
MASLRKKGETPGKRISWTTAPRHLRMVQPCKPRRARATGGCLDRGIRARARWGARAAARRLRSRSASAWRDRGSVRGDTVDFPHSTERRGSPRGSRYVSGAALCWRIGTCARRRGRFPASGSEVEGLARPETEMGVFDSTAAWRGTNRQGASIVVAPLVQQAERLRIIRRNTH